MRGALFQAREALLQVLEDFLTVIVFVVVYLLTDSVFLAASIAMLLAIGQFAYARMRGHGIDTMQWLSWGLVIVLGAASLLLDDPRFVMVKPTVGHVAIAGVMMRRGWMRRYMPPIVKENITDEIIVAAGYAWAAFIFSLGVINLYFAFYSSVEIWGLWMTAALAVKVLAVALHIVVFRALVMRSMRLAAAGQAGP